MIKGEKIYLRPLESNDLAMLNEWKNNEKIFKYLGGGFMPVSIDQQEKWLNNMIDLTGNNKRYIICKKKSGKPIGMTGLYGINWIHRTAEIGLYIGDKAEQGKGYASESYRLIESFGKNYLNLRKIKINVVKANSKANKMWKKLGFTKAGLLKKERYIDGSYYDLLIMEKFID